jgi:copper homeostasis protein
VVFGILDEEGQISKRNEELVGLAHSRGLQATFHRAFDQVREPVAAMGTLIEMGFDRVLTSGLQQTAIQGIETIRLLQELYGRNIQIMAGSGVNSDNVSALANTGIENLHFTARRRAQEQIVEGMGVNMVTDEEKIQAIKGVLGQNPNP